MTDSLLPPPLQIAADTRKLYSDRGAMEDSVDAQRLIDIETKLAYQEHLLVELNDALAAQQSQIGQLEQMCRSLIDRVRSLSDSGAANPGTDERPPHY